ncbi:MAG: hypothetical protein K6U11_11330, partial [bacterium]|nr:hypothetical protein [bacterium]
LSSLFIFSPPLYIFNIIFSTWGTSESFRKFTPIPTPLTCGRGLFNCRIIDISNDYLTSGHILSSGFLYAFLSAGNFISSPHRREFRDARGFAAASALVIPA